MATNKQGTVESCGYKNISTKRGNSQIWSFRLVGDDNWYKCGFDKPERPDGVRLLAGDLVKFSFEEDQYGKQVDVKNMKVKMVADPAKASEDAESKPAPKKSFGGSKQSGGGRDDYWAKKEEFDKAVTQPLIMRQAANNVAANLVVAALEKDILPLPSKKADKWEAYMLCYNQVRDEIFAGMMKDYETLQEGGSLLPLSNVTDEEGDEFDKTVEELEDMNEPNDSPEDWGEEGEEW